MKIKWEIMEQGRMWGRRQEEEMNAFFFSFFFFKEFSADFLDSPVSSHSTLVSHILLLDIIGFITRVTEGSIALWSKRKKVMKWPTTANVAVEGGQKDREMQTCFFGDQVSDCSVGGIVLVRVSCFTKENGINTPTLCSDFPFLAQRSQPNKNCADR